MEDREVVASIVAGDPGGLAEAYDRYAPALHAYCRSMLREPADAADAVQDTFVIAASRLRDLREPDRLRPWLYTVARNLCLRKLRADKAAARYVPALTAPFPHGRTGDSPRAPGLDAAAERSETDFAGVADPAGIGDRAELAELRALVRDAAGGLTSRDREILRLRLWEGLGPDEAGAVLGVSRDYANALLARARDQLAACVGGLLVARSGRRDCAALGRILADWDGELTILLRKRLSRHIERCDTCSGRRRRELVPALLGLSPAAAFAGAAAHILEEPAPPHGTGAAAGHAAGLPAALKEQTLAAAAGHAEPASTVSLDGNGFPKPAHHADPRLAHLAHAGPGQVSAVGTAVAVAGVAVAVALALTLPGGGRPRPAAGGIGGTSPGGVSTAPGHAGNSGGGHAHGRRAGGGGSSRTPVHTSPTGNNTTTPGGAGSALAQASRTAGPAPTSGNGPRPAPAPPGVTPPAAAPSPTSPASPPESPPASLTTGMVSVTPTTVLLTPLLGGTLTITAIGGPVSWSISERSSLIGSLSVSPSSGHLAAGASTMVTISASSLASLDTTLTATPGGAAVHVLLGVGL